jgi:hypothetical protein
MAMMQHILLSLSFVFNLLPHRVGIFLCRKGFHGYNCNLGEFIQIETDSISCIATISTGRDVMLVIMYVIIEMKEQHAQMIGHNKKGTESNLE